MVTLRPYQLEAINAVRHDWDSGLTDVLVSMATGLGKTLVFLTLIDQIAREQSKARFLLIGHRQELISQPLDRLLSYYPDWEGRAGVVMADQDQPDRQLIIATIQTLASSPKRLERIGAVDYLICDEAHHFTDKNTYWKVLKSLKETNPSLRHLGVTATPVRADGDGLAGVYQKESYHYGIVEGIRSGYLAPVRWLAIQTAISVAGIKTVAGDFQQRGLSNVFETSNCFDLVVESHKRYASGRQAAAYTVTVDGAYRLAEAFNDAGIPAAAADGTTDKRTRAGILADFAAGRTQVLVNVGLWTEGLDVPQISCIHQVRPTKSDGLYTQIIGRALRIFPGKNDALIMDYCPAETRNIAMAGDVLGVPLRRESYIAQVERGQAAGDVLGVPLRRESYIAQVERGQAAGGWTFDGQFKYLEGSPEEIISRQLNYLDISPWSWFRDELGWMSLGLGEASDGIERILLISPPDDDGLLTLHGIARHVSHDGDRKVAGPWRSKEIASGAFVEVSDQADRVCSRYGSPSLANKTKAWRSEPPTDRQIAYARRLKGAWKPGRSKGELAQAITHAQALQVIA